MLRIDNIRHERLRDVEDERVKQHLGAFVSGGRAPGAVRGSLAGTEREIDEVGDGKGDEEGGDEPEGEGRPEVLTQEHEEVWNVDGRAVVGHVADGRDLAGGLERDQGRVDTDQFD